jgi:hypothetical protein
MVMGMVVPGRRSVLVMVVMVIDSAHAVSPARFAADPRQLAR